MAIDRRDPAQRELQQIGIGFSAFPMDVRRNCRWLARSFRLQTQRREELRLKGVKRPISLIRKTDASMAKEKPWNRDPA